MGTPGYVYALINPSTPGLIKVGMTSRDPSDRVSELSSATGVATPFILIYKDYFLDCQEAEKYVHTLLERQGIRVSANREFFQGEVSEVIKAIASTPGKCEPGSSGEPDDDDDLISSVSDELDEFSLDDYKPKTADQEVYEEAERYYYGFQDTIQDYSEAFILFKQAAKLGSADAYHMIGRMYADGEGVRENYTKSLEYFKEAARRGAFCSYGRMADIFRETSHTENEGKAWAKFFEELSKNPNASFESDSSYLMVSNFLFWRTSNPTMFSGPKINLTSQEQKFIPIMRIIKDKISKQAYNSYEMTVERFGENDTMAKKHKAIAVWLSNI